MKIFRTHIASIELPLKEAYTIAYETLSSIHSVFLLAETDSGIRGIGCAAPDKGVTGETLETSLDAYRDYIEPALRNADPFDFVRILEALKLNIPDKPSAIAMTDMMLYDLVSKKAGVPLYKYLGGFRDSIPTSITIGIMSAEHTLEKARQYFIEGFRIFKLKGGISCDEDIEKVRKLRELFGKEIIIRFDANQGYSVEDAIRFVNETRESNVELLEQPTPRKDTNMLGRVSNNVPIPVMADESLMSLRDVFSLTRNNLTDMINIKLMKVGGITEAMHINSVARAACVEAMVGCMDEPELSISAGLHFALSRSNIIYADLDGHLDIVRDPSRGVLQLKEGVLYPSSLPGLGLPESSALFALF